MLTEKIDLYACFGVRRGNKPRGYLYSYRHAASKEIAGKERSAILIFPGGGYSFVSEREWEPVALYYYGRGLDAYVLEYNVAPDCAYPTLLQEGGMAMMYLRREGRRLHSDGKIAVLGFSSGGHLSGCISLLWDDPVLFGMFGEECARIRPDAAVLAYAVVSSEEDCRDEETFVNFCGEGVPYERYSLEKCVRPSAPPVFLWATADDAAVPVENSIRLYRALCAAGVPAEYHAFYRGEHGLSVCSEEVLSACSAETEHVKHWLQLSVEFLCGQGFFAA